MGRVVTCGLWFAVLVLASSSVMGYETKSFQVYRVNPQARPNGNVYNMVKGFREIVDEEDLYHPTLTTIYTPRLFPAYVHDTDILAADIYPSFPDKGPRHAEGLLVHEERKRACRNVFSSRRWLHESRSLGQLILFRLVPVFTDEARPPGLCFWRSENRGTPRAHLLPSRRGAVIVDLVARRVWRRSGRFRLTDSVEWKGKRG